MLQLDFFMTDQECELIDLRNQVEKLRISQDKIRKAMFARHGKIEGGFEDLSTRLEIIERMICRG